MAPTKKSLIVFLISILYFSSFATPFSSGTLVNALEIPSVAINSRSYSTSGSNGGYDWVVAIILDGDNDIEYAALEQFLRFSNIGSSDRVLFVALLDRHPGYADTYGNWSDTRLFIIDYGETPDASNADASWGELNMGGNESLYEFLRYVFTNFAAKHYMLVLFDHGKSFFGLNADLSTGDYGDSLELVELRDGILRAERDFGRKLDIILFDMCVMGAIDVVYAVGDLADIVIASEHWVYAPGIPHDYVLQHLVADPGLSPIDLASIIVNNSVNDYFYEVLTMSAINTSAIYLAVSRLNRLAGYILRHYDVLGDTVFRVVNETESFPELKYFNYQFQKDLVHVLLNLRSNTSDSQFIGLIDDAIESILNTVLFEKHKDMWPNSYGLAGVFFGGWLTEARLYRYRATPYGQEQQWVNLIEKWLNQTVPIWLYDLLLYTNDTDLNGFEDKAWVGLDLDTEFDSADLNVKIYAYNHLTGEENLVGEKNSTIYGASSGDMFNITLDINETGQYSLRLEVYNRSDMTLLKRLHYGFDEDATFKIVLDDPYPPEITIMNPENNTVIEDLEFNLRAKIWDISRVDHTSIYINSSLAVNITSSNIDVNITLPSFGNFNITLVAEDAFGNTASKTIFITAIDTKPPTITIHSPFDGQVIYSLTFTLNATIEDESPIQQTTIYLNDTYEIGTFTTNSIVTNITLEEYGRYKITVKSTDTYGNTATNTIWIEARADESGENGDGSGGSINIDFGIGLPKPLIQILIGILAITIVMIFVILMRKKGN